MSRALVPKIRILIGAVVAIGPGRADLLGAIARTGSISAAAREMKMSYRRAWLLVEAMNVAFRRPLVETRSEERRVGKEGRYEWWAAAQQKGSAHTQHGG